MIWSPIAGNVGRCRRAPYPPRSFCNPDWAPHPPAGAPWLTAPLRSTAHRAAQTGEHHDQLDFTALLSYKMIPAPRRTRVPSELSISVPLVFWHWQPAWSAACAMSACQPLPTKPSPPRRAASFPREPSYSYHEASTSQRRGGDSNPSEKPVKTQAAPHGAAHNPAQPPAPGDLAEVVSAWPSLPPDVKRRILALVRSIRPVLQVPRDGNNDICITISAKPLTQPRMRDVTPCDYWSFFRFDQGAQGSRGDSGRRLVRCERSMGARGGRA